MFSFLPLRILYFPCYIEVFLDFKLERILKKFPKIFQRILCRRDKWNLFLSPNTLLFDVLTILMRHFVVSLILSHKEKKYSGKLYDFFFRILSWMGICLKNLMIYHQSGMTMNIRNV